jgi:undecaprenyl-diphosphatase
MDILHLFQAAILGLVEGATEFIPVSSTGHLILVQKWMALTGDKQKAFEVFIQLGAILAVVWLYRRKIWSVLAGLRADRKARQLVINLVVGTIPVVVIGLPTRHWVEDHLEKPFPVAMAFVIGGVAILLIERLARRASVESVDDIPHTKALGVGAIQVLSVLFPGTSRAGATIMGGLALGLSRKAAAEFSFFLAIPAMFGATAVSLLKVRHELTAADAPFFGIGFVVAFLSALVVVKALIGFVSRRSFTPFAIYRIVFGAGLIWFYWNARGSF